MFRILLLISLLVSSLAFVSEISASVTYTPGPSIAMTGTNTNTRFDVASALSASGIIDMDPALLTSNKTFTGTFYAKNIGWILFASGSNQVSLNCGGQSLSNLLANCTLTGTWWSENVGDIYFSSGNIITYNPNTWLLSGSAMSFAWDIDLTGIALPLRPVILNESTLVANHIATLSVSGAWIYDAGILGWQGSANIGLDTQSITGTNGVYTVDFSLSNTYTVTIRDTNDSKTEISGFFISPSIPITSLESGTYHAIDFCTNYPTDLSCPDGATRTATILVQSPVWSVIADGSDIYTFILKSRDKYGNRVISGTIAVSYDTTVKNIQTEDNFNYLFPVCADAIRFSNFVDACGEWRYTAALNTSDITYTVQSTAPTNTNNEITLNSIEYNGSGMTLPIWRVPLDFVPLFASSVSSSDPPIINTPNTFEMSVVQNSTTVIIPTIITTMQIGDGSDAEWRSLGSTPTAKCSNYPFTIATDPICDWSNISSIATISATPFTSTGTYTTWLPDAPSEPTTMTGYIYYRNGTSDVLYMTQVGNIAAATARTERVKVLGQSGEWVGGGTLSRVNVISDIRRQIALLNRNRTTYDDVDYQVISGDYTISDMTLFDGGTGVRSKRTIIVLGGDITIDTNISPRPTPLAIMALADSAGNGWNIKIKWNITDISSSLIAEHAIISAVSDSQLYIHGSLVSANPPREIAPTGCPYFTQTGCLRSYYDLPGSRDAYSALSPIDRVAKQSTGGNIYPSPLVIEWDPRLIHDPAPAMSK